MVVVYKAKSVISSTSRADKPEVRVFPNPVRDALTVLNIPRGTEVTLVNALGAVVGRYTAEAGSLVVDVKGLAAGVYFAVFEERELGWRECFKVVKW